MAEALGKLHGERLRAALVSIVEQVTQLLEAVVAADVELGDQRQVVDPGDRGLELEEAARRAGG